MPKAATRQADKPIVTGAMHGDKPRQRTVPASQAEPSFNHQASSVFALAGAMSGKQAATRGGRRARLPQLDLSALEVRTDLHPARLPGGRAGAAGAEAQGGQGQESERCLTTCSICFCTLPCGQ